jgi:hypothetical protein
MLTNDQADSSRNHIMFGTISAFFWKYLAGLTQQPHSSGWKHIRVAPSFGEVCTGTNQVNAGGFSTDSGNRDEVRSHQLAATAAQPTTASLESVTGTLGTVAGDVQVSWKVRMKGGMVHYQAVLNATVPAGVQTAKIVVPCVSLGTTVLCAITNKSSSISNGNTTITHGHVAVWRSGAFYSDAGSRCGVVSAERDENGGVSFTVHTNRTYQFVRE